MYSFAFFISSILSSKFVISICIISVVLLTYKVSHTKSGFNIAGG